MALVESLVGLFLLTAASSSAVQHESFRQNCSAPRELLERLSVDLKVALECGGSLASVLSGQDMGALLLSLRNVTDAMTRLQLQDCRGAEPHQCPLAELPDNGGLVCVVVASRMFCKPLCNHGYDFGFMRRTRLYEECSERTGYQWQSQYVGGNTLAVCNKAPIPVSGAETAYFPEGQDCLTTKSSVQLSGAVAQRFLAELKSRGVEGEPHHGCLVCGRSSAA